MEGAAHAIDAVAQALKAFLGAFLRGRLRPVAQDACGKGKPAGFASIDTSEKCVRLAEGGSASQWGPTPRAHRSSIGAAGELRVDGGQIRMRLPRHARV
jgi:hypothetical protein